MNEMDSYKKSSFGPAFFFLSPRKRAALEHYYAFCRLADDIVDEPQPNPQQALKNLLREVEYIYIGAPQTTLGKALVRDVQDFKISKDRFAYLIEGMQSDLDQKRYASFEELNWYLYRVAVIVGKTTLDILGVKGQKADELAQALGTAVQLTNIVRDVQEDAKNGRVYLPCGLDAQAVLQTQSPAVLIQTEQEAVARAKEQYARAFELMDDFWPLTILPCRIMGYVYQKNLAKIEKKGFKVTQPIKLTKKEKIVQVLYALFKTFF